MSTIQSSGRLKAAWKKSGPFQIQPHFLMPHSGQNWLPDWRRHCVTEVTLTVMWYVFCAIDWHASDQMRRGRKYKLKQSHTHTHTWKHTNISPLVNSGVHLQISFSLRFYKVKGCTGCNIVQFMYGCILLILLYMAVVDIKMTFFDQLICNSKCMTHAHSN